jgi:hypothetical protein
MLTAMEIALGVALGVLGAALVALAGCLVIRRGHTGRGPARPSTGAVDDLPGFLEHPPGTAGEPPGHHAGWAALAPPPPAPSTAPGSGEPAGRLALVALGAAGVLLMALAIAVVAGRDAPRPHRQAGPAHEHHPTSAAPSAGATDGGATDAGALAGESLAPGRDGVAADLAFGGVVLERRVVGVTATYPRLEVVSDGERSLAHVELPTYNCLADRAPADPVAAGCSRSSTEYADLSGPGLTVVREGGGLRIAGRFPTYLRPNGTAPAWTGRTYELTVTAGPRSGDADDEWSPATGTLRLGPDRTSADPERSRLRHGN